jgi:hypothetical protein
VEIGPQDGPTAADAIADLLLSRLGPDSPAPPRKVALSSSEDR